MIGSKEGLAHFVLMAVGPGDTVLCPDPGYPIHQYSVTIADGRLQTIQLEDSDDFLSALERAIPETCPKLLILSFPHNPIEEQRIRQAVRGIRRMLEREG